ncbi:heme-binding protein [Chryseobacterium sp. SNU WT5]|uniref:GlcG/HbpS family heme-binding protein n=1 Tax=Chryseobacterium sp. SNU WT5 TaxID=2594269 RepID=UPI001180C43F|nr:heme-binding protein [Chryseobacterium sp. SNU WT5]
MIKRYRFSLLTLLFISVQFSAQMLEKSTSLNQQGAMELAKEANNQAQKLDRKVSIAVLNNAGVVLLLLKGDQVGPHNTEASRKKAYTSFSTQTATWDLMFKAANSKDAKNLNTMQDLLLLGGGMPVFKDGDLVGSLGISGGGSGENDHNISKRAVETLGFKVSK